jgi:hypothetical protein
LVFHFRQVVSGSPRQYSLLGQIAVMSQTGWFLKNGTENQLDLKLKAPRHSAAAIKPVELLKLGMCVIYKYVYIYILATTQDPALDILKRWLQRVMYIYIYVNRDL